MATFKFGRAIDLHWQGYEIVGPAETVFSIPDQLYEEFNDDIAPVEPTLVWIDTNEFNTLSELNNKVYYQTSEPTSPTLTVGDLWVDSDATINGAISSIIATSPISSSVNTATAEVTLSAISASTSAAGVVQLSDSTSTTSSVLAATPTAVKAAYDLANLAVMLAGFEASIFGSSGVIGTIPRSVLQTNNTHTSGQVSHTRLIPHKNFTVSNIAVTGAATASSGLTLCRFGIYTRSGTTFTLVARTASDTTIFNTASTKYTRALDTTGGYPATYAMTAGTEYWLSVIQVGTTVATTVAGLSRISTGANNATGPMYYTQTSQTDLPSSSTGTISANNGGVYAEVS